MSKVDLTEKQQKDVELITKIRQLKGESDYDLHQYFQDRADQIKSRLWTTGTWLIALMVALIAFSFQAEIIQFRDGFPPIVVKDRWPAGAVALLGLLLAWHAYYALEDHKSHIESNWFRADYVKEGCPANYVTPENEPRRTPPSFATHGGWVSLLFIGGLLPALYLYILWLAVAGLVAEANGGGSQPPANVL